MHFVNALILGLVWGTVVLFQPEAPHWAAVMMAGIVFTFHYRMGVK